MSEVGASVVSLPMSQLAQSDRAISRAGSESAGASGAAAPRPSSSSAAQQQQPRQPSPSLSHRSARSQQSKISRAPSVGSRVSKAASVFQQQQQQHSRPATPGYAASSVPASRQPSRAPSVQSAASILRASISADMGAIGVARAASAEVDLQDSSQPAASPLSEAAPPQQQTSDAQQQQQQDDIGDFSFSFGRDGAGGGSGAEGQGMRPIDSSCLASDPHRGTPSPSPSVPLTQLLAAEEEEQGQRIPDPSPVNPSENFAFSAGGSQAGMSDAGAHPAGDEGADDVDYAAELNGGNPAAQLQARRLQSDLLDAASTQGSHMQVTQAGPPSGVGAFAYPEEDSGEPRAAAAAAELPLQKESIVTPLGARATGSPGGGEGGGGGSGGPSNLTSLEERVVCSELSLGGAQQVSGGSAVAAAAAGSLQLVSAEAAMVLPRADTTYAENEVLRRQVAELQARCDSMDRLVSAQNSPAASQGLVADELAARAQRTRDLEEAALVNRQNQEIQAARIKQLEEELRSTRLQQQQQQQGGIIMRNDSSVEGIASAPHSRGPGGGRPKHSATRVESPMSMQSHPHVVQQQHHQQQQQQQRRSVSPSATLALRGIALSAQQVANIDSHASSNSQSELVNLAITLHSQLNKARDAIVASTGDSFEEAVGHSLHQVMDRRSPPCGCIRASPSGSPSQRRGCSRAAVSGGGGGGVGGAAAISSLAGVSQAEQFAIEALRKAGMSESEIYGQPAPRASISTAHPSVQHSEVRRRPVGGLSGVGGGGGGGGGGVGSPVFPLSYVQSPWRSPLSVRLDDTPSQYVLPCTGLAFDKADYLRPSRLF